MWTNENFIMDTADRKADITSGHGGHRGHFYFFMSSAYTKSASPLLERPFDPLSNEQPITVSPL
jgi:hypothetical protein